MVVVDTCLGPQVHNSTTPVSYHSPLLGRSHNIRNRCVRFAFINSIRFSQTALSNHKDDLMRIASIAVCFAGRLVGGSIVLLPLLATVDIFAISIHDVSEVERCEPDGVEGFINLNL
jgi:hypothetical protein